MGPQILIQIYSQIYSQIRSQFHCQIHSQIYSQIRTHSGSNRQAVYLQRPACDVADAAGPSGK